jgi:4-hydroxy-2-oxoheptanedioate aldolase
MQPKSSSDRIQPFDLGNNIGHPILDGTMHDNLKEAIATILKAAKDNFKKAGIYCTSGEQARQFADQGFQMVSSA